MSAKDYTLEVAALSGKPYICKNSKRDKHLMLNDRAEIPKQKFINAILVWADNQMAPDEDTLCIAIQGKVVAEIKIDRKALGL